MLKMLRPRLRKAIGSLRSALKSKKRIVEKDSAQEAMDTLKRINDRLASYYEK